MTRGTGTRARLQDTAVRLFTENGYDNVTVEQIAAAAGVSHMTFFRNFPTKASVLIDDPYDPVIGEMVAATDPDLPLIERVLQGIRESWARVDESDDEITKDRLRLLSGNETLLAAVWSSNRATERVIVDALTSTGASLLRARVAAGAVIGALMAALIDWGESDNSGSLGERIRQALEILEAPGD
jgi:AcrR family transcriptional regulator